MGAPEEIFAKGDINDLAGHLGVFDRRWHGEPRQRLHDIFVERLLSQEENDGEDSTGYVAYDALVALLEAFRACPRAEVSDAVQGIIIRAIRKAQGVR